MFRNNPKHLKYTVIPESGAIAISPLEGDPRAENDKVEHFVANVADARLSDHQDNKELHIYIGSGLHMIDSYAQIQTKCPKNSKIATYEFSHLADGEAAYKLGVANTLKWVMEKASALCDGASQAVEANRPETVGINEQRIYIYTPNKNEIYSKNKNFATKGSPILTIHLHAWHKLWANHEQELIAQLSKALVFFNLGQSLIQKMDDQAINEAFAGTGLTATIMKHINDAITMKNLPSFNASERAYMAQVLGLNANDFENQYKKETEAATPVVELNKNTSYIVYARIMMACWFYFKQKTAPHCKDYLKAGITQDQINAVFRANLMFTLAELATLTFFPDHILYMVPGSMDEIQGHLSACSQLLFNKPLSFPIKATDPKKPNANAAASSSSGSSSSLPTSTSTTALLGDGYRGQIDRASVVNKLVEFMGKNLSNGDVDSSIATVHITMLALKQIEEKQLADLHLSNNTESNSRPSSDSSKSSPEQPKL